MLLRFGHLALLLPIVVSAWGRNLPFPSEVRIFFIPFYAYFLAAFLFVCHGFVLVFAITGKGCKLSIWDLLFGITNTFVIRRSRIPPRQDCFQRLDPAQSDLGNLLRIMNENRRGARAQLPRSE